MDITQVLMGYSSSQEVSRSEDDAFANESISAIQLLALGLILTGVLGVNIPKYMKRNGLAPLIPGNGKTF